MNVDLLDPNNRIEIDPVDLMSTPDRVFWEALREIFRYYLTWEFRLFWMKPWFLRPPCEVFDAMRTIDSWLIEARELGMFDDDSKQ